MPRIAEIGATRNSHIYRARVPPELQESWEVWCVKIKKKPPGVIRMLMSSALQDDMPTEVRDWIATQAAGQPEMGRRSE
jgi:hypothetical protein